MLKLDELEVRLDHQKGDRRYDGREEEYDEDSIFWMNYGEV